MRFQAQGGGEVELHRVTFWVRKVQLDLECGHSVLWNGNRFSRNDELRGGVEREVSDLYDGKVSGSVEELLLCGAAIGGCC